MLYKLNKTNLYKTQKLVLMYKNGIDSLPVYLL